MNWVKKYNRIKAWNQMDEWQKTDYLWKNKNCKNSLVDYLFDKHGDALFWWIIVMLIIGFVYFMYKFQ